MVAEREIEVAAVQMRTDARDRAGNVARAREWVERAVGDGAKLVLLPEFFHCGYSYELAGREACEPLDGASGSLLGELAREHGIWVAGGIYEDGGTSCFNAFVLVGPDGQRFVHRKRVLPSFESILFEPGDDPIVVETPLGRIALVICAESLETSLLREVAEARPDLVLIAYSSPGSSPAIVRILGGPPLDMVRRLSARWARVCGAPHRRLLRDRLLEVESSSGSRSTRSDSPSTARARSSTSGGRSRPPSIRTRAWSGAGCGSAGPSPSSRSPRAATWSPCPPSSPA